MGAVLASWTLAPTAFAEAPMGVPLGGEAPTVRVWAPHASSVAIVGDFNNGKPMAGDRLVKDEASGIFSGVLRRGRLRGAYQFLINGELPRRDPYARAVTPDGRSSLFYDPSAFAWPAHPRPRYALEDLVIYEMHIGTFHDPRPGDGQPATFADAARRLDYLVELGVNTLCLLPVHEFNGRHSWGYNPSDLFAVEQAYGGPDGLKAFVAACHARGLAVHLDIVHNHYGPENLDLLRFDGAGNALNGGIYFYEGEGIGMTPWGPRVRFEQPMVRRFIRDNVVMWLDEYRVDGFRWDSTINIRAYDFGRHPIPEGARMLEDINREIRERYPGVWSIAEDSLDIGNFHASWDYDFHHAVMPVLAARTDAEREVGRVADALARGNRMPRVVYVDNHDEAGKINGMFRIATDVDPANPGSDRARRLCGLGAVLTFTAPGIPLLFMGNEFQEYGTFHDDIPLDWSKTRAHAGTLALHRDLIALRRNREGRTAALRGAGIEIPAADNQAKTLVYWRTDSSIPDDPVVVAINFSGKAVDLVIPFPAPGPWVMRLNSDAATYGGEARAEAPKPFRLDPVSARARTTMAPYSARIYALVEAPRHAAPTPAPAPAPAPKTERPPLSMYASIHLVGNFNDHHLTDHAFLPAGDYRWEGTFAFRNVQRPTFRISANTNGVIFWGRPEDAGIESGSLDSSLKRLGSPFEMDGVWDGLYRFIFDEDALRVMVKRIGDAPDQSLPPDAPPAEYRVWTDSRGATLEARAVVVDEAQVTLETREGRRIVLPIERLSPTDREALRTGSYVR
ncbi:MAG TPA: alpha-amylase family glycosyl hydrolase [Kiritimatiellia bacterium]|nr:alpha-amylase family glycosyl hydrolase [Kiritimatiellia bacterium]